MHAAKSAVQAYWNHRPCGFAEVAPGVGPEAVFATHARLRYGREPEILDFATFSKWRARRVLEIGVGIGADYVRFSQAGALAVGVDLSSKSVQLARQNAATNGVHPLLLNADAESLPFADNSFDLVYSWGVLHHSPDLDRTVREVHRVLRPGAQCRVMLYNRHSILALQCYLRYGLGRLRPFTSLSGLIAAHIESPGTRALTRAEVRSLFAAFRSVHIQPTPTVYDLRLGRRRFAPRALLRFVPKRLGWFLLIRAVK